MLIDWFTVGAQLINFLILMWLLKRFLYKPIIHAIDEREKRIAKELADADKKRADAQKEGDDFKSKNEAFDQERAALLTKATDEANAERDRLLDEAKKSADAMSIKRQDALKNEEVGLNSAIRLRTQGEVFAIARKTLKDLAGADLESRIADAFLRRLRGLTAEEKAALVAAFKSSTGPAIVHSAFPLPPELATSIVAAVKEIVGADKGVQIETAPDLISGIELVGNGQKVAWSIGGYLASLEEAVHQMLKDQQKPPAQSAPMPVSP